VSALGPRGFTVLSIAGVAGICLAVLGWTQRGTGLVSALAAPSPTPSASASATAGPASRASVAPTAAASRAASSPAAGPLLSTEPYASFAYQVWPGPLTADGRLAMAGFVLNVTRQANGITVNAVQDGQKMTAASHFYPGGAKVYILDSNLGDEGGSVDYNLTDDGLIVTNAQNQVLP
jgi:hypothetical protein